MLGGKRRQEEEVMKNKDGRRQEEKRVKEGRRGQGEMLKIGEGLT